MSDSVDAGPGYPPPPPGLGLKTPGPWYTPLAGHVTCRACWDTTTSHPHPPPPVDRQINKKMTSSIKCRPHEFIVDFPLFPVANLIRIFD